jgi:hypothetical protein
MTFPEPCEGSNYDPQIGGGTLDRAAAINLAEETEEILRVAHPPRCSRTWACAIVPASTGHEVAPGIRSNTATLNPVQSQKLAPQPKEEDGTFHKGGSLA